jgi:hypothetical protein
VLRIFIALKNPSPRPGLNPRPLDPVGSTLTTTPLSRSGNSTSNHLVEKREELGEGSDDFCLTKNFCSYFQGICNMPLHHRGPQFSQYIVAQFLQRNYAVRTKYIAEPRAETRAVLHSLRSIELQFVYVGLFLQTSRVLFSSLRIAPFVLFQF